MYFPISFWLNLIFFSLIIFNNATYRYYHNYNYRRNYRRIRTNNSYKWLFLLSFLNLIPFVKANSITEGIGALFCLVLLFAIVVCVCMCQLSEVKADYRDQREQRRYQRQEQIAARQEQIALAALVVSVVATGFTIASELSKKVK